jgi:hypothetical protein
MLYGRVHLVQVYRCNQYEMYSSFLLCLLAPPRAPDVVDLRFTLLSALPTTLADFDGQCAVRSSDQVLNGYNGLRSRLLDQPNETHNQESSAKPALLILDYSSAKYPSWSDDNCEPWYYRCVGVCTVSGSFFQRAVVAQPA